MSSVRDCRLEQDGYTILARHLSRERVIVLRRLADALPWDTTLNGLLPTLFAREPLLVEVITEERTLQLVEQLVGPGFVIFPNFAVRRNSSVPWHIDPAFRKCLGGAGSAPAFIQCAIYLQENSHTWGGGLDVVPGSHHRIIDGDRYFAPAECLDLMQQKQTLPIGEGDLVVWDGRLLHASSAVSKQPPQPKYAIHWTVASRNADYIGFLRHLRLRSTPHSGAGSQQRYKDMEKITFPTCFSPDVCARLARYESRVATMAEL